MEQRIYRVDRWALPVPGGVPLRGVIYFAVAVIAMIVLNKILGPLVGLLSPPLRYVVVPLALAMVAARAEPDGRTALSFARSWLEARWQRGRRSACRRVPNEREAVRWRGKVRVRWDVDAPTLRRCRVQGPAVIEFRQPVETRNDYRANVIACRGRGELSVVRLIQGRSARVK